MGVSKPAIGDRVCVCIFTVGVHSVYVHVL